MLKPMRFVSGNRQKIIEYEQLLAPYEFLPVGLHVREPQGDNQREIVRGKVLAAFAEKRARLFVDHTGINIDSWNNLPGGLSREIWNQLGASGFLRLLQCETNRQATVRTIIGYCCTRRIHIFESQIQGVIATEPDGPTESWECLFIPDECDKTLAAMPLEEKNRVSARSLAARDFKDFLAREAVRTYGKL